MAKGNPEELIISGCEAACSNIYQEDKIWSRYSNDKVDVGEELARVIRTLFKAVPLSKALNALSVGSSAEPQFRILETAFRAGLYLLDLDDEALCIVKDRIKRQYTHHVTTIKGDYNKFFADSGRTESFLKTKLGNKKMDLITLHHSLYYSKADAWADIFKNLYRAVLAPTGAIHAVLMTPISDNEYSTTWLYNYFVNKFFNHRNDQDLMIFGDKLKKIPAFKKAQICVKTHHVNFFVEDFAKFMKVIWMVLLYPNVHKFTSGQMHEIAEFVYNKFWKNKRPLVQEQHHLIIYRGLNFKGLSR